MNKSKIIVLTSVILAVFVLAGCKKKTPATGVQETKTEKQETVTDKAKETAMNIKDAIAGGKSMECEMKVGSEGNMVNSKFSVQGEKYRSEADFGEGKMISTSDGKVVHTWNEVTKEGTKISFDCIKSMETSAPEADDNDYEYSTYKSSEQIIDDAPDPDCKSVGSIDFSIPTDVNFIDQCEMLKKAQESLKNLNIPELQP